VALRRWLYDERAPTITVFACVLIILGAGLTGSGTLSISGSGWIDLAFAITPPITYGLYAVIMARWSGTLPATASASIIQFGYSTGFIIMCLFAGLNVPTNATAWGAIFAAGILGSAFHVLALAYSLPRLGATGYGILTSVELVTVVLLGVWLLDEVLTLWQWLGVACVLIGIVIFRPGEKRATAG
jgi:drug/metabolite transporter (DMT)-like permease